VHGDVVVVGDIVVAAVDQSHVEEVGVAAHGGAVVVRRVVVAPHHLPDDDWFVAVTADRGAVVVRGGADVGVLDSAPSADFFVVVAQNGRAVVAGSGTVAKSGPCPHQLVVVAADGHEVVIRCPVAGGLPRSDRVAVAGDKGAVADRGVAAP